ncbi:MAG: N-acetylmuramoyl-L-alanine amidase, partial [Kiritimatiellae bacterium]|nr:N-acetylmuramoyl-L-alanine amidase [Kiritimatiellia bacterium]
QAMEMVDSLSPYSRTRGVRPHTRYIVLHTTEAHEKSSLNKLRENGEAHYLVGARGVVYRIVDTRKIARHAGVSMWEGHRGIDDWAIGIEVVGYHDREITAAQYRALRELLSFLQSQYTIPDERVITHSMVAYGEPNKWHKKPHRGRKRCGMLFARDRVRAQLGLTAKPAYDPDVRAGRLVAADEHLELVLYGSPSRSEKEYLRLSKSGRDVITKNSTPWDVAGADYNKASTLYIFPDGSERKGSEIRDWATIPAGTKVVLSPEERYVALPASASAARITAAVRPVQPTRMRVPGVPGVKYIGADGENARQVAGERYREPETIYLLPDGCVRNGQELKEAELDRLAEKTAVLIGYTCVGYTSNRHTAQHLCADRWNHPDTFYRLSDGRLVAGHELQNANLPRNTLVFCRN